MTNFIIACLILFIGYGFFVTIAAIVDKVNHLINEQNNFKATISSHEERLSGHDESIDSIISDFNGMYERSEKEYQNHMKDMNTMSKSIIKIKNEINSIGH